jgi:hypothetical protein
MSSATAKSRSTASSIHDSTAFRAAARVGFAVNGLLHILIGALALGVAFGSGSQEADQGGALQQLASNPLGAGVLWVVVVGLFALGLFQVLTAALVRGSDKDAWFARAKEGGKGIAYLAVGFTAFRVATGGSSDSSQQTQSFSATLLSSPWGVALLVLVGLGTVAIGVYFVVKGVKKKFLADITLPSGPTGDATTTLGLVGYIAKGVAIAVVGILFIVAAFTSDASKASGLDGALKSLAQLPFGVVILTAVALGLIAFGVYSFVRARYARL